MNLNNFTEILVLLVIYQLSGAMSIPKAKSGENVGNLTYVGTVDYKAFYADSTSRMNWTEAREYCNQNEMYLASIESHAQAALLNSSPTTESNFWSGARDAQTVSQFVWDSNHYRPDESIVPFSGMYAIQTCVMYTRGKLEPNDGYLDPRSCSENFGVLCQKGDW